MDDRTFVCGGTRADGVLQACPGIVPVDLDHVILGINLGPNPGTEFAATNIDYFLNINSPPVLTHPSDHAVEAKYRDVRFRT